MMKRLAICAFALVWALTLNVGFVQAQVQGSGTPGQIPVWIASDTVGDSVITQAADGRVGIGAHYNSRLSVLADAEGAIVGVSNSNDGVFGQSNSLGGVVGVSNSSSGVFGQSTSGAGVVGVSNSSYGGFFQSSSGLAGYFSGNVEITGILTKGGGSFKIDHPLDPANKYLSHSFVESPDMMNIYNGNITTDAKGNATVTLPDYFVALNRDYRYQLTVIGQFAQAIVTSKIKDNRFTVKTDKPNIEVSWQVTGIRHDAYANAHRIPVEENKLEKERGTYLHPELFGQPKEKSLERARQPEQMPRMKAKTVAQSAATKK